MLLSLHPVTHIGAARERNENKTVQTRYNKTKPVAAELLGGLKQQEVVHFKDNTSAYVAFIWGIASALSDVLRSELCLNVLQSVTSECHSVN